MARKPTPMPTEKDPPFPTTEDLEIQPEDNPENPVETTEERLERMTQLVQAQSEMIDKILGEKAAEKPSKPTPAPETEDLEPLHRVEVPYSAYCELRDGARTWVDSESQAFRRDRRPPTVGDQVSIACSDEQIEVTTLSMFVAGKHGSVLSLARAWAQGEQTVLVTLKPRHYNWLVARAQYEGTTTEAWAARCITRAWQSDQWRSSAASLTGAGRQELMKELKA
jgi:hypothetical protein